MDAILAGKGTAQSRNTISLIGLAALVAILAACRPSPQPIKVSFSPTPTPPPPPVSLPADELPHHVLTEWWYFTGHLQASNRAYGFEFVIFQSERRQEVAYAAHFAITDHQRSSFRFSQATATGSQVDKPTLDLAVGGWRLQGAMGRYTIKATMEDYSIELNTEPVKPPVLHAGGIIDFGPAGSSYYYSYTRLSVAGVLMDGNQPLQVSGTAWMDHQWGNFIPLAGGGWDWFSLQLDTGDDLMVFLLRDMSNRIAGAYISLIDPQGKVRTKDPRGLQLLPTGAWTSHRTGTTYPSGWILRVPDEALELRILPVLQDQELDTRQSTGVIYWEGEVTVKGASATKPVGGKGYVELTGYSQLGGH